MKTQFLIAEPPIQVFPILAEAFGFNEAAILQIIHSSLSPLVNQNFKDGCYWVRDLVPHLNQHFLFWDEDTIGYTVAQFEQSGILTVRQGRSSKGAPLTYHTINYDQLGQQLIPTSDNLVPDSSLTQETSTEKENSTSTKQPATNQPAFKVEVHEKGPHLYIMEVEDKRHFLACDLTLEIQDATQRGKPSHEPEKGSTELKEVICDFPGIADGEFQELIQNDDTLYEIIIVIFQMHIMKHLLAFCIAHNATRLVIFADDEQEADLEIYRNFLAHKNQTSDSKDRRKGLVFPADRKAFYSWIKFMGQTIIRFQQTLWRGQKNNPAIKDYLKQHGWPEL